MKKTKSFKVGTNSADIYLALFNEIEKVAEFRDEWKNKMKSRVLANELSITLTIDAKKTKGN